MDAKPVDPWHGVSSSSSKPGRRPGSRGSSSAPTASSSAASSSPSLLTGAHSRHVSSSTSAGMISSNSTVVSTAGVKRYSEEKPSITEDVSATTSNKYQSLLNSEDDATTVISTEASTALLSDDIEACEKKEKSFRNAIGFNVLLEGKRLGFNMIFITFGLFAFIFICIASKSLFDRFVLFEPRENLAATSGWTLARSGYDALDYFTSANVDGRKYTFLQPYRAIIEPYAAMELYVEGYKDDDTDYYTLSLCPGANNTDAECIVGTYSKSEGIREQLVVQCSPFDEYAVTITQHTRNGEIASTDTQTAVCMYVRRELRALTSSDLAATMEAMKVMWEMTDDEGFELYGSNFHNATYWTGAHHFNAAWKDADHIHEGLGFLPQHLKITNMFELSMQAVDPSISLPYWDYTIEAAEGVDLFGSYAFTNQTFGSLVAPFNRTIGWTYKDDKIEDARIPDSLFKDITIDYNTRYPDNYANFGYLRAPWNTNPSRHISRFAGVSTPLPTCGNHYTMLQYDTLTDFLYNSPYGPHASVHGGAGEVYGCDLFEPMLEAGLLIDFPSMMSMCKKWGFIMKELYRKNFLSQRTDCSYTSLNFADIDCTMSCTASKYDYMTNQLETLLKTKYAGSLTDDGWEAWRDFVCEGNGTRVLLGDHTESASPADPSFWPIHPTLERLYHARLLMGDFVDTEWPTDAVNDYVCDKAKCYEAGEIDYYSACCYGHYENDQLLDFISGDKQKGTGLTNAEILQAASASTTDYTLPYVFDSFTWDHCPQDFEAFFSSPDDAESDDAEEVNERDDDAAAAEEGDDAGEDVGDDASELAGDDVFLVNQVAKADGVDSYYVDDDDDDDADDDDVFSENQVAKADGVDSYVDDDDAEEDDRFSENPTRQT